MSLRPHDPPPRRRPAADGESDFWGAAPSWSTAASSVTSRRGASRRGRTGWRSHGDPTDELPAITGDIGDVDAIDDIDTIDTVDPLLAPGPRRAPAARTDPDDGVRFAGSGDEAMPWDVAAWDDDAWDGAARDAHAEWDDGWDVAPPAPRAPRGGAIDPLIARIGGLAVLVTLAVPAILGMTGGSSSDDTLQATGAPNPSASAGTATVAAAGDTSGATAPTPGPATATASADASAGASTSAGEQAATTGSRDGSSTAPAATATLEAAPTADPEPTCRAEYEVSSGDYWIRIADAAGVRLAEVLAVNDATIQTMLVPGRSICLPAGASMPDPPAAATPTTATPSRPSTTAAPTRPATTAAPSTAAPTTTAPTPTTTPPPPPPSASEVEAIIRSVWPDDLEARALEIAWRESNYVATAKNWCCYGIFQINWNAHRSWLAGLGVTAPGQLLDAEVNVRAAYTLYQRSGGFGPWGG